MFSVELIFLINTVFLCQNILQEIALCLHISWFSYLSSALHLYSSSCRSLMYLLLDVLFQMRSNCPLLVATRRGGAPVVFLSLLSRSSFSLTLGLARRAAARVSVQQTSFVSWWGKKWVFHWSSSLNWFSRGPQGLPFQMEVRGGKEHSARGLRGRGSRISPFGSHLQLDQIMYNVKPHS